MLDTFRSWLYRARLLESAVLISLLLIVGSVWVFVETADEVLEGEIQTFDDRILRGMRGADGTTPIGPGWLLQVGQDLTALGGVAVITLITLGAAGFLALRKKWRALCFVLVAIVGGLVVSTVLKGAFERERPDAALHLTQVSSQSFPSGHSMLSAVTYFTLAALLASTTADRRIKAYFMASAVLLSFLIGLSRMYLGVHYPTDVLAGWCAGIAWALMCSLVARWLRKKGAVEQETPARGNQ